MITLFLRIATFATLGIAVILLAIEIGKGIKYVKGIDKNKIREQKEEKQKAALNKLIADAQKQIDELNKKKGK